MPFLQLTFAVGALDPEPFEDALLASGALSITLEDAEDNPVLEPAPGTTPLWQSVRIKALFEANAHPDVLTVLLQQQLPAPLPTLTFTPLGDRIWEREWLKDFRPMRFGRRLWICPDRQRPAPESLASTAGDDLCFIDLDPGLAFGTGTHPTTALCLEWLDQAALEGTAVIDYGCGSGVLAIAALKLGAQHAVAVDIDPQAVTATIDNAGRNGVADRIDVGTVSSMQLAPADIVLANILAGPLEALAESLASLVVSGGHVVLSGLLAEQAERVASRYRPWFDIASSSLHEGSVRDGWARLVGVRRAH
jgi:ribosomal protein L11 methyltransferase